MYKVLNSTMEEANEIQKTMAQLRGMTRGEQKHLSDQDVREIEKKVAEMAKTMAGISELIENAKNEFRYECDTF